MHYCAVGTAASPQVPGVPEPSATAGRKIFAYRAMLSALCIFTNRGVSGTGTNSIFILVKILLPTVAKCSMVVWTVTDFYHVRS